MITTDFWPDAAAAAFLDSDRFSGVVSVVIDGETVFEHVSGMADVAEERPVKRSTRFVCASVTKMFTAVCVGRLVDAGLCRFETPVAGCVESPPRALDRAVTLGDLLAHRSGLADYIDDDAARPFAGFDVASLAEPSDFAEMLDGLPAARPGAFHYSSAGYVLVGLAIERLTGLSYFDAIARYVTEPAGLAATDFPRMDALPAEVAHTYFVDGTLADGHVPVRGGPDGGIATTVDDIRGLFRAIEGPLLTVETRRRLLDPVSRLSEDVRYGLGFLGFSALGRDWRGHSGGDPGVSARAVFEPGGGSSIVVLCNRDGIAFRLFRQMFDWPAEP